MTQIADRIAEEFKRREAELAESTVEAIYAKKPELVEFSDRPDRMELSIQDVKYHLSYLAEAIDAGDPTLFAEYVDWVRVLFEGLHIPDEMMRHTLEQMRDTLEEKLDGELSAETSRFLEFALSHLESPAEAPDAHIESDGPLGGLASDYLEALLDGDRARASRLVLDAVEGGVEVKDVYMHVFQKSQYEIGRLWQTNRVTVAQEHFCTAATQLIMSQLYPYIFSTEKIGKRLVAACVGGELHEIGIRMVADFFEMAGWDTYYMGANTPTNTVLQALDDRRADVLGLSTTIMYHKSTLEDLIGKVRETEAGKNVKILVGGYPFLQSPNLWRKIGADGFAADASQAVRTAEALTKAGD